jgi:hypothetical protein
MFYFVEPEVAGGIGPKSETHRENGALVVTHLHYEFDGWLGDALLETTPCFILSDAGREAVEAAGLRGVRFKDVEVTRSPSFMELYPARELPSFEWMLVDGVAYQDDFGIAVDQRLVVSQRALGALKAAGIEHAIVEPADG